MTDATNKQQAIVDDLRRSIVGGRYEPASRLPTRTDLLGHYGVSPATLQRAFDTLIEDGFVETRGRAGTFVSPTAPHLTHYAVLLHGSETQSRLYLALAHEANRRAVGGRRVSCYFRIDQHLNSPDYQRLLADLQAHRVAGILFSTNPFEFVRTPLMTLPGIPRCAIMSEAAYPSVCPVWLDLRSFVQRALEHVAARGRRRVAWLFHQRPLGKLAGNLDETIAAHGLISRPSWHQYLSANVPLGVSQTTRLLFDTSPEQRPDALIISDDNLVEPASAALAEAGIAPDSLDVVACCNYPEVPPSAFPVVTLGFDIAAVVEHCFATIDRMRQGQSPGGLRLFPAVFAHELTTAPQ